MCFTMTETFAEAMTVGDLQKLCIASNKGSKMACRFYILGISQGIEMGTSIADGKTRVGRLCVPEDASSAALELAVKIKIGQDLMIFPDDRKLDASGAVGAALINTFPCRQ
jgi:hypothetical protein